MAELKHHRVCVCSRAGQDDTLAKQEKALAKELGLSLCQQPAIDTADFFLAFTSGEGPRALGLYDSANSKLRPTVVDFLAPEAQRRSREGRRTQGLLRALGKQPAGQTTVVDATAGLGGDAFQMLMAGFRLTLLERSPVVFALLRDGLDRLYAGEDVAWPRPALSRCDLKDFAARDGFDVVYLDPMYADGKRKSAAKRDIARLHRLLGAAQDETELLDRALELAHRRVVVKRARQAPALAGRAPSLQLAGSATRFDVYLVD